MSNNKEWDTSQPSRGLGDTIAKFAKYTKIDRPAKVVIKAATGNEDCGCSKRQAKLNKAFPYKKNK